MATFTPPPAIYDSITAAMYGWKTGRLLIASPIGSSSKPSGPYRPSQWNNQPQLYSIKALQTWSFGEEFTVEQTYYFDAVLRADHTQELILTKHPVQSGAPIVDHAYLVPAQLTLEIGMSDAMDRYDSTAYTPGSPKSVSAYQTFLDLQSARTPMTVATRLRQYNNMLLRMVRAQEDNKTRFGLRATLVFEEIIEGVVQGTGTSTLASQRNQASQETQLGTSQPAPPNQATVANYAKPPFLSNIPGAGWVTSNYQHYMTIVGKTINTVIN